MLNDPLSNALSSIMNSETVGKKSCTISPGTKLIAKVLKVMQDNNYLGSATQQKDIRNSIKVNLLGRINKCGSIKPRFPIKLEEMEEHEKRFLPAKGFGILILSTTKGVITNTEAKKHKAGGRLLAYCY